ncbi:MAG: mannonate dehydratase [Spirochaetes bacterium]|nr:mannonate dehydratase [Spirochaetota bacterium]
MKMTMRWYGEGNDSVTLEQIRQIPNVKGIVGGLHNLPAGEVWPLSEILNLQKTVEQAGLELEVIESVNVHEDIKLGSEKKDFYIDNYIATLENLAVAGIKVVCYNFMPVFDWTRSSLNRKLEDGSYTMDYDECIISKINPSKIAEYMLGEAGEFTFPGWEPERLVLLDELFSRYKGITEDMLRNNLKYFLERIIPVCEKLDIKMAMHPDDPPWDIFGLPRIARNLEDFKKNVKLVDNLYNGITFCTGCLGAGRMNDIPRMISELGAMNRIHFAHIRNIKFYDTQSFYEVSHRTDDGDLDMFAIVKAFVDTGFDGYVRPDHGRMIWNEKARPGYGLYDRALGIAYLNGLFEGIIKMNSL